MMFSVQMHSRSKRHVNAQKIDVHATAVATILRPIGRPCANIIPPLSYSPATLFSSPPLPPPNQTKPNPTQAKPSQPNPGQPPTDDRFLYLPFYPPSSSTPLPHSHLLLLSIRPYYSVFPSPYIPFSALSPAPLPPSYRASFFSSLSTALATLAALPQNLLQGSLFSNGGGRAAALLRVSGAHRWLFPFTLQGLKTTKRTGWLTGATSLFSLSRGNRTYRPRSCLDRTSCMPITSNDR